LEKYQKTVKGESCRVFTTLQDC